MKKTARIVAALVLAVMLTAALSAAAWADDASSNDGVTAPADDTSDTFNKTATVTVNGVAPDEIVNLYKVASYADDYHSFVFDKNFEAYLDRNKGAAQTAELYFAGLLNSPDTVRTLIDGFVNLTENGLPASAKGGQVSEGATSIEFSNVEPGYYIITVQTSLNDGNIYLPMSVFVRVVGDKLLLTGGGESVAVEDSITLNAKSAKGPSIEKEVWCKPHEAWSTQTDATVGDVCSFVIPLTIPAYTDVAELELSIVDTMTNMSYVDGSAKVYAAKPAKPDDAQNEVTGAIKTVTYDANTNKLTLELDYDRIIINGSTAGCTVYVFYQAVITADAAASGVSTNTAVLEYDRPGTQTQAQRTAPKTVTVYNYAFTLKKENEAGDALSGATFSIYTNETGGTPMSFSLTADGYYVPDAKGAVTVLPADSAFNIRGLGHGTYYVQEVSTPRGYFLPEGRLKLDLASFTKVDANAMPMHEKLSENATGFTYTKAADEKLVGSKAVNERTCTVSLRNATLPVLPSTGGVGTAMFTVGGAAVMVLAAVLFLRRKKED